MSTAECNDARYIRESNFVRSPLDKIRLNYYRPKVDSGHKGSESGAKERSNHLIRNDYWLPRALTHASKLSLVTTIFLTFSFQERIQALLCSLILSNV